MKRLLMKLLLHLKLPFWFLYGVADVVFVIVYYLVGYRLKVVMENLRNSFPDKSDKELKGIARRFYRHLADYLVETSRISTMSEKTIRKRMEFKGVDIIDDLLTEGKSVIVMLGHCGNFEWVTSIVLWSRYKDSEGKGAVFSQIYRPLKSEWADEYFLKLRSHFHTHSLPKASSFRDMVRLRNQGFLTVTGSLSDQKPSHGDHGYITMFLNQPTAFISGTERVARKLNFAVVYLDMTKPRRGHYVATIRKITDSPREMAEGKLTETYAAMLEQSILRTPHIWLWSHKRWKIKVELPIGNADVADKTSDTDKNNSKE